MIQYALEMVSIFISKLSVLFFLSKSSIKLPDKSTGPFFKFPHKPPFLILKHKFYFRI